MSKRLKDQADDQATDQETGGAADTSSPSPGADQTAQDEAAAPGFAWEPHEEVPQAGGSYIRQPDGSLVKVEQEEDV